jgi:hypothetical protein
LMTIRNERVIARNGRHLRPTPCPYMAVQRLSEYIPALRLSVRRYFANAIVAYPALNQGIVRHPNPYLTPAAFTVSFIVTTRKMLVARLGWLLHHAHPVPNVDDSRRLVAPAIVTVRKRSYGTGASSPPIPGGLKGAPTALIVERISIIRARRALWPTSAECRW